MILHWLHHVSLNSVPETALKIIGYYLRRWRVEDFFRVLKSGCRAEHLGFHSAERLQRALTIQAVIAWRVMLMTLLAREVPHCDAELMFTDIELRFLADYAAHAALCPRHATWPLRCSWWPSSAAIKTASTIPRPVTRSCGEDTNACPPRPWATGLPRASKVDRDQHSIRTCA